MTNAPGAPEAAPDFPRAAAIIGLVAVLLVCVGAIVSNLIVGDRTRAIVDTQYAVFEAAERVARTGQASDAALELAVESGEAADASAYERSVSAAADARSGLERAIQLPQNRIAFAELNGTARLLDSENRRILDDVAAGDRVAADLRLRAPERRALKEDAARLQNEIYMRSRAYTAKMRDEVGTYLDINLYGSFAAVLLLVAAWLLVVRPARDWARELKRMEREAARLAEAKGQFVAVMSHEIRTPLNGVIGFADLLLTDDTLSEQQRHRVEVIHSAGGMLLSIVNDVLDYSKLEAGQMRLVEEDFALESLIDNCVSVMRPAADVKALALDVEIGPDVPTFVHGDRGRLSQILMNLIGNAVKFTARGHVAIRVRCEGEGRLAFAIEDSGPGMSGETMARLFTPFTQADASVARDYGGTGLGLSISRHLAHAMGGDISVASVEGEGATFTLVLPLAAVDGGMGAAATGSVAPASGAHILLAEDVPMNQELATAMLTSMGHEVTVVNDGIAAVSAVRGTRFDLVLMDIQMPHMDGLSAARAIRAMGPDCGSVPIVALTANGLPEQIIGYRKAGMDGHVAKPIHRPALEAALAKHLGTRSAGVGQQADVPRQTGGAAPFDATTFDKVRDLLGEERVAAHLKGLADALDALGDVVAEARGPAAHKLASQAATLGLARVAEAARLLETAPGSEEAFAELTRSSADVRLADAHLAAGRQKLAATG